MFAAHFHPEPSGYVYRQPECDASRECIPVTVPFCDEDGFINANCNDDGDGFFYSDCIPFAIAICVPVCDGDGFIYAN